jgi:hypothetical protein
MCFGPVAIEEGDEVGEGTIWDGLYLGVWDVWKNKFGNISEYQKITIALVAFMAINLDLQLPYDDFYDQLMIVENILWFNSS